MRAEGGGLRDACRGLLGVAGYSALGYAVRRRRWDPAATEVDLTGKVCVVTGGSLGLGIAVVRGLAERGATVVIACRNVDRGEAARRAIAGADRIVVERMDVSSLREVKAFASRFAARFSRLDVLVNNAGALFATRGSSVDGLELTFATNVLGGYALTRALAPRLIASAPSRIIHVGSAAQYLRRLDVRELLHGPGRYVGELAYAHSKRAVGELSASWAEHLREHGVTSNCMHPGLAATPGVERSFPIYRRAAGSALRSPAQGADTAVWLAVASEAAAATGGFWLDRELQAEHVVPWTRAAPGEAARLREACERLAT